MTPIQGGMVGLLRPAAKSCSMLRGHPTASLLPSVSPFQLSFEEDDSCCQSQGVH